MSDKSGSEPVTYVKLVSAEGNEYYIDRSVAVSASKTMRTMLTGNFREAQDNVINFPEISNYILERVIQYLYYQVKVGGYPRVCTIHRTFEQALCIHSTKYLCHFVVSLYSWLISCLLQKYSNSTGRIPEFPIEPEIALELLIAAKYLDA